MNLANQITIGRILLVPFFVTAVVYYRPDQPWLKWTAAVLFFIGSVSDAVDGWVARVRNEQSSIGTFLDPFADKLLLISSFFFINFSGGFSQKIPQCVLIVIVSREVLIISGLVIFFLAGREVPIKPSMIGKATTVAQMITVSALLLELPIANSSAYGSAVLTIVSGLGYVFRAGRKINEENV